MAKGTNPRARLPDCGPSGDYWLQPQRNCYSHFSSRQRTEAATIGIYSHEDRLGLRWRARMRKRIRPIPERFPRRPRVWLPLLLVELNEAVARNAKLLTLEAMKIQSNVYAPVAGRISKIHVAPGQQVEGKDLLFTITP